MRSWPALPQSWRDSPVSTSDLSEEVLGLQICPSMPSFRWVLGIQAPEQIEFFTHEPSPQPKLYLCHIFVRPSSWQVPEGRQEVGEEELSQAIGGWEIIEARLTSRQSASLFIQNSLGRDGSKLFQPDDIVSAFRHLFHFLLPIF